MIDGINSITRLRGSAIQKKDFAPKWYSSYRITRPILYYTWDFAYLGVARQRPDRVWAVPADSLACL